ncbi:MAG: exodeoxyribonuclease V subunit beta [Gammaproteobacteria bacterium]
MSVPSAFRLQSTPLGTGVTLLEANAGTGKTFTIAGIVTRLVALENLPVREILVVTFTEAATRELSDRIRKTFLKALRELSNQTATDPVIECLRASGVDAALIRRRLELALASFDEASISTIHGICQRILRDHAFEGDAPFDAEIVTDPAELLVDLAHDFWHQRIGRLPTLLAVIAEQKNLAPTDLATLLLSLNRHPHLAVIPSRAQPFDLASRAVTTAYDAVIAAWKTDGARLCNLLETHKSISKNKKTGFSSDRIRMFRSGLDRSIASGVVTEMALDAIDALTESAIEERLNKKTADKNPFPNDEFFTLCSRFVAAKRDWVVSLRELWLDYSGQELLKIKAAQRIMTFDDMLNLTHSALHSAQGTSLIAAIRKQYRAALIDEFQDTDPLQYDIFRTLFSAPPHRLMLIGDPKQSIYGFRGADLFTYLGARRDAEAASPPRIHTLNTNYRSTTDLVAAVNDLFESQKDCFLHDGIEFSPSSADGAIAGKSPLRRADGVAEPPMVLIDATVDIPEKNTNEFRRLIAIDIAVEISRLLDGYRLGERAVTAADIAILVRFHREAELIEDVLREAQIPAVRQTDASVFHSVESEELIRVLSAVLEPSHERAVRAALAVSWMDLDATAIAGLESDSTSWAQWLDLFSTLRERWLAQGFSSMFRYLLITQQCRRKLVEQTGGERKLTNLLQLGELAQQAEQDLRLPPASVIEWIREQRRNDRTVSDEHIQRLEKDDDAVKIVTIHNAKGLEYPIVFCPSHWAEKTVTDVLFHDPSNEARLTLDLSDPPTDQHKARAERERLAEDVRLFYVAVTRAAHRCHIYAPQRKDSHRSALGLVLGQDIRQACSALAHSSPVRITYRPLHGDTRLAPRRALHGSSDLQARKIVRKLGNERMIGSFSQWVAGTPEEIAQDHDDLGARAESGDPTSTDTTPLARLPRGAATGIALHSVLEHVDFQRAETFTPLIAEHFGSMNLDDEALKALTAHLTSMMSHPLRAGDREVQLQHVARQDRLNEIEFYYPLQRIDSRTLAAATSIHSPRLQFNPVDGFLRGFMDLVFRHEGRYFLLDWKSNWLGPRSSDYSPERLTHTMNQSLYSLQSWLYALALDRYLAQRLSDYHYDRHFGGIFYVFVRGLDAAHPDYGVHFSKPEHALIKRLADTLLRQGVAE